MRLAIIILFFGVVFSQAPGGIIEKSYDIITSRSIADNSFIPATRGAFDFPEPYNTRGYRITIEDDGDVEPNGYAYWMKMNNHADKELIYILVGIMDAGVGATIYTINKTSEEVTKVGPVWQSSSPQSYIFTEAMFMSYNDHEAFYYIRGDKLNKKNFITGEETVAIDLANSPWSSNHIVYQVHSSGDEQRFSFTLKEDQTYATLGCGIYFADNNTWTLLDSWAESFDECQIDKSGRYVMVKTNTFGVHYDLDTGAWVEMSEPDGYVGHSDNGYGVTAGTDNYAPAANRWYLYDFEQLIYHSGEKATVQNSTAIYTSNGWSTNDAGGPNHLTWNNAKPPSQVPWHHQFMCGSNLAPSSLAKTNEIVCFKADNSYDTLIVAPVSGISSSVNYGSMPKAALDRTGDYILWSTPLGEANGRKDVLVARVPWHLLVDPADYNPDAPLSGGPNAAPSSSNAPSSSSVPSASNGPSTSNGPATPLAKTNNGSALSAALSLVILSLALYL